MKNKIILSALAIGAFVFGTNNAQAQTHTATTAVNITLKNVITIDKINSLGNEGQVDFNFTHLNHYNDGLSATVPNSLIITSTKNFDIHVKAEGANLSFGSNDIPVEVLTITAAVGGSMAGVQNSIILSKVDQLLIGNVPLGSDLTLNLDYTIPGDKSSSDILGMPAGTYTQNITYTARPKLGDSK